MTVLYSTTNQMAVSLIIRPLTVSDGHEIHALRRMKCCINQSMNFLYFRSDINLGGILRNARC